MTQFPHDDSEQLVGFLRQHAPVPPAASPDLEDWIIRAIESRPNLAVLEPPTPVRPLRPVSGNPRSPKFWVIPSAIAASFLASILAYQAVIPKQPSEAELAKLEAFMEETWYGSVHREPEVNYFPVNNFDQGLSN